jgi:hypothetical protein
MGRDYFPHSDLDHFSLRLVEFHFFEAAEDSITRKTLQRVAESPRVRGDNRRVMLLHRD